MSNGHSTCSLFELFLGFLTGVVWLLLATTLGVLTSLFTFLNLGIVGTVLHFIIAILGFLAVLLFGICIFKRAWGCCCGKKSGC
ncbi:MULTISPECIES: hypothetical protein [Bacillaceae]|uniref:ABC transporter n=1 Tax=Domibacillus aminovorans TaxID=29332 RepID=A0A177KTE2_9BACI|nr:MULTISPECIES: hypothetical protein [Bacillaceae]OAH56639.1 ABC transporter [Domibacillus aminovorans]